MDLLSENEIYFISEFFMIIFRILNVCNVFTTTFHHQINAQLDRINWKILAALLNYI